MKYRENLLSRMWWMITWLPTELPKIPRRCRLELRHWWQRRTRGWDDTDCWSLDAWLVRAMAARLPRMKEMKRGVNGGFFEDPHDESDAAFAAAQARQDRVFDEMIEGFQIACDEPTCWMLTKEQQAKVQRAFDLLARYHFILWD